VDAKHCLEHLREEKPEGVENECVEQVAFADRILLNKCDLVKEEEIVEVERQLKGINSSVDIIRTQNSVVDPQKLINIGTFQLERVLDMDPEFLSGDGEHAHDSTVSTCSATFEGELNMGLLQNFIDQLVREKGTDLFRYKGILAVKGFDQKMVFQGVHMMFSQALLDDQFWKPGEKRSCTFVFIGRNLDKEGLIASFHTCKVTGELRFPVGTAIETKFGENWLKGEVLAQWDKGHPYRLKLADGRQIWAPMDQDHVVRRA
jgi:G3E family GTPase